MLAKVLVFRQLLKLRMGGTGFASVHFQFASQKCTGKASATPILGLDAALGVMGIAFSAARAQRSGARNRNRSRNKKRPFVLVGGYARGGMWPKACAAWPMGRRLDGQRVFILTSSIFLSYFRRVGETSSARVVALPRDQNRRAWAFLVALLQTAKQIRIWNLVLRISDLGQ